jgi:hypothetical protein
MPEPIILTMDASEVIQSVDAEIGRLEKARALLWPQTHRPSS